MEREIEMVNEIPYGVSELPRFALPWAEMGTTPLLIMFMITVFLLVALWRLCNECRELRKKRE